jgi:hypothetical protein
MVTTTKKVIETKAEAKENLLTPRFYTTNFKEISELDITSNQEEIEAIVEEFRIDYNRDHFIRDKEFLNTWDFFDDKTRNIFIEFLERSCTAEFSGFLLYKEISRNLKKSNPLLAEGFSFMSRDEARHAVLAMLRLRQDICRNEGRLGGGIRKDKHLARAGQQVDGAHAEGLALRLDDVAVAGAEDFDDGANGGGAK